MRATVLHVGTFTKSLLIHLANESGVFAEAGLDVRESSVTSSPAQFSSLVAGELDIAITSPDNVIAYRFLAQNPLGQLIPVEIISAVDRGLGLSLCLAPSVKALDEVRGRVVGVDVANSGFAFVAYELLRRSGLQRRDYETEVLGSTPRRTTALIANQCAATILNAGNELRAVRANCTLVSSVAELGPYLGTVIAAVHSDSTTVLDARRRFAEVMLATSQRILAGGAQSDVVGAAMSILDLSEDDARAHYACLRDKANGLVVGGIVDRASIATLLALRQRYLPSGDLDSVLDSLPSFVVEGALE
jgi:hypothetical protein